MITMLSILRLVSVTSLILLLESCAFVPQMKRQYLSDPIMQLKDDAFEANLNNHDRARREGATGGTATAGGGCGC